MKIFLIDSHSIYRRGLAVSLATLDDVETVSEAEDLTAAWEHAGLADADLLLVDHDIAGGEAFIRKLRDTSKARIMACSSSCDEARVLAAIEAGAVGYLCKDTLTPDTLAAAVRAVARGAGVIAPELLGRVLRGISRASREVLEPHGLSLARLSGREQDVLRLVADGHPTREVAQQLSYSERTVKNVLHDVVTKMNARSRSQAVAVAVREGLI